MKLDKNWDWKNSFPLILCIVTLIFANVIADRPMQGNFIGSITNSNTYPDLMEIDDLKQYLGLFPNYDENNSESYGDNYDKIDNELRYDLENSILNGMARVSLCST
jgi:hypothetical protein